MRHHPVAPLLKLTSRSVGQTESKNDRMAVVHNSSASDDAADKSVAKVSMFCIMYHCHILKTRFLNSCGPNRVSRIAVCFSFAHEFLLRMHT